VNANSSVPATTTEKQNLQPGMNQINSRQVAALFVILNTENQLLELGSHVAPEESRMQTNVM